MWFVCLYVACLFVCLYVCFFNFVVVIVVKLGLESMYKLYIVCGCGSGNVRLNKNLNESPVLMGIKYYYSNIAPKWVY